MRASYNTNQYVLNSDGVQYWQQYSWDNVEGHFTNRGEVTPTVILEDRFSRRVVYDNKAWTTPFAQPCISDRSSVTYPITGSNLTWLYRGGNQPWAPLATTLASFAYVPTCYIVNHALSREVKPVEIGELTRDMHWHHSRLLGAETLFPKINLKDDPFKTSDSLWYLLVDVKRLPELFEQLQKLVRQQREFRRIAQIIGSQRAWKTVANSYLIKKFALDSLVQDIESFIELVLALVIEVKKKRGMSLDAAFHTRVVRDDIPEVKYRILSTFREFGADAEIVFDVVEKPLQTRGCMSYYFVQHELSGFLNRIAQFVDRSGLLDPAVLWDLLPWSFVMDWFLHVGTWLSRNVKPRLFPSDLVVADYCESSGQTISWTATMSSLEPVDLFHNVFKRQKRLIAFGSRIRYSRERRFPAIPAVNFGTLVKPSAASISIRRVLIGSALVGQKSHVIGTGKTSPNVIRRINGSPRHVY